MSEISRDSCREFNSVELSFPVPWGIIAGKAWGDPCLSPVLMVHGIQDNAGTFDRLLPYLPRQFYYVCIDLPGHGRSSRFPKGMVLEFFQYLISIQRIVKQLQWSTYAYIGHSFGGQLGSYYAALYPEEVTKLVMIDTLAPQTMSGDHFLKKRREGIKQLFELESKLSNSEPPSYTFEEALDRLIKGRRGPIKDEAARVLAIRSLKKNKKNFYYFSTDQRLKFGVGSFTTTELHLNIIKSIQCPVLLIITDTLLSFVTKYRKGHSDYETLEVLKSKNNFQMVEVPGHHDIHNDSPDLVSPYINAFLLHIKSLL